MDILDIRKTEKFALNVVKIVLWIFGKIMIRAELPLLFLWRYTWKSGQDLNQVLFYCIEYRKRDRRSERIIVTDVHSGTSYYIGLYCLAVKKSEKRQGCK